MYDFKTAVNRVNQGSAKWLLMKEEKPDVAPNVFPFSVADTDLVHPPELINGLKDFLDEAILGYTSGTDAYYQSVIDWMEKRHNWSIKKEWIIQSPGIITALYNTIKAFTKKNEGVIIMPPVYYPFKVSIENSHRKVVENTLVNRNGRYEIDFEDLERKASDPNNKLLIFCSPHNPVGRVWEKEELAKVGAICTKHQVLLLSDEIHFDLVMPGYQHHVLATISESIQENVIICTAPSKSFNLAGMQTSNIVIPNEQLRTIYAAYIANDGFHALNILGQKACEIAYTTCEKWLDEFVDLIHHNHLVLKEYMATNIPEIQVFELEGTYLQWMDFNALGMEPKGLEIFLKQEADLFFDEGYIFGECGNGFERMNIACPTDVMVKGLDRLAAALQNKKGGH